MVASTNRNASQKLPANKLSAAPALLVAIAALTLTSAPAQAQAQVEGSIALNIMRECAKIGDEAARLACFDNNIRNAGPVTRATTSGVVSVEQGRANVSSSTSNFGRDGFGREDIRTDARFDATPGELSELSATVTDISQRERGIYVFTLEDGAQWIFTESKVGNYSAPRVGSTVEINRGALGGFLMRFNNQISVRVRRLR